ncbi:MAG: hypothetical protein JJT81_15675 [Rubellimicrobium sp.]|nr:hypothetical protein [Rubellimicrobium sp.]
MTVLTLHVGAAKCGSSALQAGLTRSPLIASADGAAFTYTVVDHKGRVLKGNELVPDPVYGYRATVDAVHLAEFGRRTHAEIRRDLSQVSGPVLSNEGLLASAPLAARFLEQLDLPVEVIAYMRPQVDFVNSAWWQWGAWSGIEMREQLRRLIRLCDYNMHIGRWESIPQVRKITLRLLPSDILADFHACLGAPPPRDRPRVNASLPGAILRLAQRHPDLHRRLGPELDFVLARRMSFEGLSGTPWILSAAYVQRIIERHRAGNTALMARLDPDQAAAMAADPRWWDTAAYAGRTAKSAGPLNTPRDEMDRLAIRLIEALLDAEPSDLASGGQTGTGSTSD